MKITKRILAILLLAALLVSCLLISVSAEDPFKADGINDIEDIMEYYDLEDYLADNYESGKWNEVHYTGTNSEVVADPTKENNKVLKVTGKNDKYAASSDTDTLIVSFDIYYDEAMKGEYSLNVKTVDADGAESITYTTIFSLNAKNGVFQYSAWDSTLNNDEGGFVISDFEGLTPTVDTWYNVVIFFNAAEGQFNFKISSDAKANWTYSDNYSLGNAVKMSCFELKTFARNRSDAVSIYLDNVEVYCGTFERNPANKDAITAQTLIDLEALYLAEDTDSATKARIAMVLHQLMGEYEPVEGVTPEYEKIAGILENAPKYINLAFIGEYINRANNIDKTVGYYNRLAYIEESRFYLNAISGPVSEALGIKGDEDLVKAANDAVKAFAYETAECQMVATDSAAFITKMSSYNADDQNYTSLKTFYEEASAYTYFDATYAEPVENITDFTMAEAVESFEALREKFFRIEKAVSTFTDNAVGVKEALAAMSSDLNALRAMKDALTAMDENSAEIDAALLILAEASQKMEVASKTMTAVDILKAVAVAKAEAASEKMKTPLAIMNSLAENGLENLTEGELAVYYANKATYDAQKVVYDEQNAIIAELDIVYGEQSAIYDEQKAIYDEQKTDYDELKADYDEQNAAYLANLALALEKVAPVLELQEEIQRLLVNMDEAVKAMDTALKSIEDANEAIEVAGEALVKATEIMNSAKAKMDAADVAKTAADAIMQELYPKMQDAFDKIEYAQNQIDNATEIMDGIDITDENLSEDDRAAYNAQKAIHDEYTVVRDEQQAIYDELKAKYDEQKKIYDEQSAIYNENKESVNAQSLICEQQSAIITDQNKLIANSNAAYASNKESYDKDNASYIEKNGAYDEAIKALYGARKAENANDILGEDAVEAFEVAFANLSSGYELTAGIYNGGDLDPDLNETTVAGLSDLFDIFNKSDSFIKVQIEECKQFLDIMKKAKTATYYTAIIQHLDDAAEMVDVIRTKYEGVPEAILLYKALTEAIKDAEDASDAYITAVGAISDDLSFLEKQAKIEAACILKAEGDVLGVEGVKEANIALSVYMTGIETLIANSELLVSAVSDLENADTFAERRELLAKANAASSNCEVSIDGVSEALEALEGYMSDYLSEVQAMNAAHASAVNKAVDVAGATTSDAGVYKAADIIKNYIGE